MATAVVDPVKMPKVQADNKLLSSINAVSITLACFLGWMTLFAGIASFTKEQWGINIPLMGWILGGNFDGFYTGYADITILATGVLTVLFAVAGLITARKITDINAMKSSWKCVRNLFVIIAGIEIFKMLMLAIYALCGVGDKSGVKQGYLWLNGFLSNTLAALAAATMAFIAHLIAQGKTQVLSIMRFVALGVAGVALIIAIISTFVNFYGKKTSSYSGSSNSGSSSINSLYEDIYNLYK